MLAIRARALIQGRLVPGMDDVAALAHPVLIHRMALGFAARAEGQTLTGLIDAAGRRRDGRGGGGVIEPRRLRAAGTSPRGRSGCGATPRRSPARCRRCWPQAELLAATVAMGVHGRRRAGHGENFWQYRQAVPGDPRSTVDWRRSGESDQQFIREMEWEAAQTVCVWVDDAQSHGLSRRRALQGRAPRPSGRR